MQGQTREQLYQPLTDIYRPPHDAPTLTEIADEINTLSPDIASTNFDPRVYEALSMKKYAAAAMLLRDAPGGRDPEATKAANTTTADAFYLMLKRRAEDIETKQEFEAEFPIAALEQAPTLGGFESIHAMSTRLFEEQVAQFPPEELPATMPEQGAITPPIEVGHIMDICHARQLYEQAWRQKKLDDRQSLLEQSYEISSSVDIHLDEVPVLTETRAIHKLFRALVEHDLTVVNNEFNGSRNFVTNDAVLTLWDAEDAVYAARKTNGDENDLAPYLEKIQYFRRIYSEEIGINPEVRPETGQPNSTITEIGATATKQVLKAA